MAVPCTASARSDTILSRGSREREVAGQLPRCCPEHLGGGEGGAMTLKAGQVCAPAKECTVSVSKGFLFPSKSAESTHSQAGPAPSPSPSLVVKLLAPSGQSVGGLPV